MRLARAVAEFVGPREAIELYRRALVAAEDDAALEAEIHLNLAQCMIYTEEPDRGLAHAERAIQAASRAGDAALRCEALAAFGQSHSNVGRGIPRAQMEEALALERRLPGWPLTRPATSVLSRMLIWSGELERARRLLEEWREALSARDDRAEAGALWSLSVLEWRAGNWELAARHAADVLALRAQFGIEGGQPVTELPAALVAAHRGHVEDARQRSERALALAETNDIRIAQSGHAGLGDLRGSGGARTSRWVATASRWSRARLELGDTLEALIAVGELAEAERRLVRGRSARGRSTARGRWRSRPGAARSSSPRGATSPAPRRASGARWPSTRGLRIRSSTRGRCSRSASFSGAQSSAARPA